MNNQTGEKELKFLTDSNHFHLRRPFGNDHRLEVAFPCSKITNVIDPNAQFEVHVNADKSVHQVDGAGMLRIFKQILKTTSVFSVLARCSIICRTPQELGI